MNTELVINLFKDGCVWHGDVLSTRWAECLYASTPYVMERVQRTLGCFVEGKDYKIVGKGEGESVVESWIK